MLVSALGCSKSVQEALLHPHSGCELFASQDTLYIPMGVAGYNDVKHYPLGRSPIFVGDNENEIVFIEDETNSFSSKLVLFNRDEQMSMSISDEMNRLYSLSISENNMLTYYDVNQNLWTSAIDGSSSTLVNTGSKWPAWNPSGDRLGYYNSIDFNNSTYLVCDTNYSVLDSMHISIGGDLILAEFAVVDWHSAEVAMTPTLIDSVSGIGNVNLFTKEVESFIPWSSFSSSAHKVLKFKFDNSSNSCLILFADLGLYSANFTTGSIIPVKLNDNWHSIKSFDWIPENALCVIEVDHYTYVPGSSSYPTRLIDKRFLLISTSGCVLDSYEIH
ncbi:MAG: hypothetical protein KDC12_05830 [Flavobacteriales bacterium]|nr:hypothetical protein [Flavobacteriales bacterium]